MGMKVIAVICCPLLEDYDADRPVIIKWSEIAFKINTKLALVFTV